MFQYCICKDVIHFWVHCVSGVSSILLWEVLSNMNCCILFGIFKFI